MAKKRKNDTRLDPFATPVSTSSLDELLEQASVGEVLTMPAPSDPTRMITMTCQVISHRDIESQTRVYGQNRREQSLLSDKSVADILPAIKNDKRNLHPALCWLKDNTQWVLSGSRRRKACLLADADYVVLSSSDFTDADAKLLAVSSDQYIAPSLWELGQAYADTKQDLIAQGKKGSYREIAELEGVSHTAIADSLKAFEQIPMQVLQHYPTPNHLGREAAKKLIDAIKKDKDTFFLLLEGLPNQAFMSEEMSDEKRAIKITQYLVNFEQPIRRNESLFSNEFIDLQRSNKSGDITIKINNQVITDKRLEQLQKLLSSYN
ncbi:MAG: transcriptional regulator [Pseudoalteromonas sp.]|uniref:transcriptional regulator n=1 Tax=Pseudoalteromonas phenolica TaxID=161398 RepID=UPI000C0B2A6D|nr:transcriptional regulator [Pseudoalteromonas sp.]|tara:strand:+ start:10046 stop:11008 length:963 start_codon:yes stop_codon:yes gene_type:complete